VRGKRVAGRELEIYVEKLFQFWGYQTHRAKPSYLRFRDKVGKEWIKTDSHDLFHCIDLICIAPEHPTLFLQITRHGATKPKLEKLRAVRWNHAFSRIFLLKGEKKRLRVFELKDWGEEKGIDLQKIGELIGGKFQPGEGFWKAGTTEPFSETEKNSKGEGT